MEKSFKKTRLALTLQASFTALGLAAALSAQATGFTLTFENNLSPEPAPLPFTGGAAGFTALVPFSANSEFRVMTAFYGQVNDGHKDVITGGEQWIFDSNGELAGVVNTPLNPGAMGPGFPVQQAPITSGVVGFPICTTPVCPTLFQSASFLSIDLNALAPVTGSLPGNAFGPATSNLDLSSNQLTVTMPAIQIQWAGTNILLGADPNPNPVDGDKFSKGAGPGVVFSGPITVTSTPGADPVTFTFLLHGEHTISFDEPSIGGFNKQIAQWELRGNGTSGIPVLPLVSTIDIIGGATQECAEAGGSTITLSALISNVAEDDEIASIGWTADGGSIGNGNSIETFLSPGVHTIELAVETVLGLTTGASAMIAIEDTIAPEIEVAFIDKKTGDEITEVSKNVSKSQISINVTDLCDPDPVVTAVTGFPVVDGEIITVKQKANTIAFDETGKVSISATATDASGNSSSDTSMLNIPDEYIKGSRRAAGSGKQGKGS